MHWKPAALAAAILLVSPGTWPNPALPAPTPGVEEDPFAQPGALPSAAPFVAELLAAPDSATSGSIVDLRYGLRIPEGHYVYAERTRLEILPSPGFELVEVERPEPVTKYDVFEERDVPVYKHDVQFLARLRPGWSGPVRAVLATQGCNESFCFFPQADTLVAEIRVTGAPATSGGVGSASGAVASAGEEDDAMGRLQAAAQRGIFWLLLLAFGAGFATSLTPCVYPMIPITIGIIGARSAGRKSKGFSLSLLYVLGIAVTYSTLGTTAALTGSLFGGILQNVWVVAFVCAVFFVMAMSLFGAFELQVPSSFATRMRGVQGSGYPGALLLGLVAGIVASPCIGPVLVAMLAFVAASGSVLLGFSLFFVFALGLGVLFVVLGTFTGLLAGIPRSGNWMLAVRTVFGLVFLGVAIYYLQPFLPEGRVLLFAGIGFLLLGVGLRGWRAIHETDPAPRRWGRALGRAALVVGLYGLAVPFTGGADPEISGPPWLVSETQGLEVSVRESKPMMIDFSAEWCVACKELEHGTFSDPRVIDLAQRFVTVRIDATEQTPEIERLMGKYGIVGLPWVAFVTADGTILTDLTVTGFIDAEEMLQRMHEALSASTRALSKAAES